MVVERGGGGGVVVGVAWRGGGGRWGGWLWVVEELVGVVVCFHVYTRQFLVKETVKPDPHIRGGTIDVFGQRQFF